MNRSSTPEARIAAIRERSARCVGRALSRGGRKRGLDRAYLLEQFDAATARANAMRTALEIIARNSTNESARAFAIAAVASDDAAKDAAK